MKRYTHKDRWKKSAPNKDCEKEDMLQIRLSEYIKETYPDVIFTAESSGLKLPMGLAIKAKRCRSSRALPDMWILEARKGYHGCCIELKREGENVYKKNGELRKDNHLREQQEVQMRLRNKGYFCEFAVGYDEAKAIVDFYLS